MNLSTATLVLLTALCTATACAAPPPPRVAPGTDPAATWLELDGARMLVTTTRAARGRSHRGLPLLIVLPWSRSTPAQALAEVGYADIEVPARIVAIQGFEPDRDGFSWWRRTRPAPADPDRDYELVSLLSDRAERLSSLVDAVQHHVGSPSVTVVTGISQGGDLSIALGILHPTAISAALPIASRFPEPMWPSLTTTASAPPPIDAFQGAADPVAPFAALQRSVAALRHRGYPVVLHRYDDLAHDVSPALAADVRACAALRLRGLRDPCPRRASP